ncbi:MAG: hypothetical protein BWY74_04386 [Firmicutes bacterium ADurb.Bin419]|nr:MAG: hypothetical protein BWY74_04386 [Firmicutes bacterium ADurb.Bin419]
MFLAPYVIYHMQHDTAEQRGRKKLTDIEDIYTGILQGTIGPTLNNDEWGLKQFSLKEYII